MIYQSQILQAQHRVSLKTKKWAGQRHITQHTRGFRLRFTSPRLASGTLRLRRNVVYAGMLCSLHQEFIVV